MARRGQYRYVGVRSGTSPNKDRRSVLGIFHWFMHDAREWVTLTAQTHPYWVFPIAFLVAFSESFVGVSFIIPGTILLLTLGTVIGDAYRAFSGRGGRDHRFGPGRLDLVVDRLSLSP